jgi:hypothetical protein
MDKDLYTKKNINSNNKIFKGKTKTIKIYYFKFTSTWKYYIYITKPENTKKMYR